MNTADYLNFWDQTQPVFNRSRTLFHTPKHLSAGLERLRLFCQQEQNCTLVTGESGSGKSTLARWLYQTLPVDSHEVILTTMSRREKESGWLMPRLAELLGAGQKRDAQALQISNAEAHFNLVQALTTALDNLRRDGRRLVVIIDGAHRASTPEAFDEILALLNAESLAGGPGCLSFILLGLPALAAVASQSPELSSRIALRLPLDRLSREETGDYIRWCLAQAGIKEPVFDEKALDLLHISSHGSIGQLNLLAENTLIELAQRHERRIDASSLAQLLRQLSGQAPTATTAAAPESSMSVETNAQEARDALLSPKDKKNQSKREKNSKTSSSKDAISPSVPKSAAKSPDSTPNPASIRLTSLFKSEAK